MIGAPTTDPFATAIGKVWLTILALIVAIALSARNKQKTRDYKNSPTTGPSPPDDDPPHSGAG